MCLYIRLNKNSGCFFGRKIVGFAVLVARTGIAALNSGHGVMPLKSESGRLPRILREIYYSENQGSNNVL